MVVSIHQPHYLPWLRYVEKIARSDVFILLDDAQYTKNGYQNRNRIKTDQGGTYLTVPVRKPTQRPIREIEIENALPWREKHARAIEMHYRKTPYFARYWPELAALYEADWTHLAPLNQAMLACFLRQLGVGTRVVLSSDLRPSGQATERLAALCRAVEGETYLSGANAMAAYLDPEVLQSAGIRLAIQTWRAPVYAQRYPAAGFVPDLSILDLLFNEGPRALEILMAAGGIAYPGGAVAGGWMLPHRRAAGVLTPSFGTHCRGYPPSPAEPPGAIFAAGRSAGEGPGVRT